VRARFAALVALAALGATLAGYRPSFSPPGLHPRELEHGAASAKLLVDGAASELTGPAAAGAYQANLAGQLAVTYALYLQSDAARAAIGRAVMGRGGAAVAASGPFTLLLGRENSAQRTPSIPAPGPVDHAYRLLLDVDGQSPVLSIYARAPSPRAAIALVNAARGELQRHVAALQSSHPLGPEVAVVLRPLGPTAGGLVDGGARWQLMGLVGGLVALVGGGLLLYARRRRERPPVSAGLADPYRPGLTGSESGLAVTDSACASAARGSVLSGFASSAPGARSSSPSLAASAGDWPYTTRLLPWALAGFLAMLFLVPFDAIDLPVGLPLDSKLDRPVLLALALLWLCALAVLRGAARPRLRLTRVHAAAGLFFAVCCLGAALDGAALANMGEVTLVVKKLALLASYILFFTIVASVLRPREAPRFAALIVALGALVAVATVVEYRTHYDVFYGLWGKLLPIAVPSDLDARDSIGRLTVYGPTSQPLELAALLAMVLPFAAIGAIDAPTRRRRALYAIAIGLLLAGGVATSRKTSLVVPAGAIVLLALYRPRAVLRSLAALALVLGALVHVTSPGALGSVLEQLEPGHFSNVLTTTDRTARYDAVAPDVLRHLLLGRGFQSYDPHRYRILDNEYLGLLITTGALGVLAYAALFAAIMGLAHGAIREGDARRASLALAALASVGTIALASALFDALSFPHVPYLLFFVAALIIAPRERSPRAARPRVRAPSAREPAAPQRVAPRVGATP
jgi:hypothetical protein